MNNLIFPFEVDYNGPKEKPYDISYGGDFKSRKICEFEIPFINDINDIIQGIIITANCIDQQIGSSGQCSIRYEINNIQKGPIIIIDRNVNKTGLYEAFIINIKSGDKIKLWLVCPPWNGWKAVINNLEVDLIYI